MIVDAGLRDAVIALAQQAARRILDVYGDAFDVVRKDDASPLTAADLASHHCIVDGLAALTPGIPVLSEESPDADKAQRHQWKRLWLVDPLDGTREFVKRNGEFCICIALIVDGVAVFGLIQQPTTGLAWFGAPGQGAWRREHGVDVPLHVRRGDGALRVAASRSHRDARTQALIDRIGNVDSVPCGSALKFCKIAEGAIDLYPRFGPTCEWDTAAGQAIVEGAGGVVMDAQGRPFRYNQRDTLLNGDFMAMGDPALPWRNWLEYS
ncbi:3'(2'),5'-bisphosphate nucleotidase [Lysobacter silvestris]|uniref:3'(2'),5'-bisphosphate nucleotidase CysQ n=2 Tax=Solilutibacter silvestris TaxID=1645665 RepID=A0A2K1PXH9_9GAMM|nr:3'(2'),5'-bisphosphate nucleotidase CysQ [Lysobacter silvestris]PNS07489.1 3'(2'),5'-bisphosphate nucleotidase [Lysobacter silvestris]